MLYSKFTTFLLLTASAISAAHIEHHSHVPVPISSALDSSLKAKFESAVDGMDYPEAASHAFNLLGYAAKFGLEAKDFGDMEALKYVYELCRKDKGDAAKQFLQHSIASIGYLKLKPLAQKSVEIFGFDVCVTPLLVEQGFVTHVAARAHSKIRLDKAIEDKEFGEVKLLLGSPYIDLSTKPYERIVQRLKDHLDFFWYDLLNNRNFKLNPETANYFIFHAIKRGSISMLDEILNRPDFEPLELLWSNCVASAIEKGHIQVALEILKNPLWKDSSPLDINRPDIAQIFREIKDEKTALVIIDSLYENYGIKVQQSKPGLWDSYLSETYNTTLEQASSTLEKAKSSVWDPYLKETINTTLEQAKTELWDPYLSEAVAASVAAAEKPGLWDLYFSDALKSTLERARTSIWDPYLAENVGSTIERAKSTIRESSLAENLGSSITRAKSAIWTPNPSVAADVVRVTLGKSLYSIIDRAITMGWEEVLKRIEEDVNFDEIFYDIDFLYRAVTFGNGPAVSRLLHSGRLTFDLASFDKMCSQESDKSVRDSLWKWAVRNLDVNGILKKYEDDHKAGLGTYLDYSDFEKVAQPLKSQGALNVIKLIQQKIDELHRAAHDFMKLAKRMPISGKKVAEIE